MAGHWLQRRFGLAVLLLMLAAPASAMAAGTCTNTDPALATTLGERISAIACRENTLWYRPFINLQGHLASTTLAEAETDRLQDGATPAWKRVAEYWRGSGLLWGMNSFPGAAACARAVNADFGSPDCRAFLVDRPWSAAFVSFVLVRAGVPGFTPSARHIDYVRDAYLRPATSPFLFVDPDDAAPTAGDLLCHARGSNALGYAGLQTWIQANPEAALAMHCDVVTSAGNAKAAYLIGGNVLQSVTLRMLALNRSGRFWNLPRGGDMGCSPDNEAACNFNRHDWVVLLKLKPSLQAVPVTPIPGQPVRQTECCVQCVVGSGVPRCPATH